MAVNSKDIEALWKQYSEEGVKKGISVVQFFESNGVPYRLTFIETCKLQKKAALDFFQEYFKKITEGRTDYELIVQDRLKSIKSNKIQFSFDCPEPQQMLGLRGMAKKGLDAYVEHHTPALMEALGIPMYFSKGNHSNIKITEKEDVDMFLGYQLAKKFREEHQG